MANVLPAERRLEVLAALVNGTSIRAASRMTGVHQDTIATCGSPRRWLLETSAAHPCEKTLVTWSVSRAIGDDGRAGQWSARRLPAVHGH
ncbi:hypothetical protein ACMHYB_25530 [Sorangium sp. So ce1128]